MKARLSLLGSVIGWIGVLVCCVSGLAKLAGYYYLLSTETQSIFISGIGLIAAGIMAKTEAAGQD